MSEVISSTFVRCLSAAFRRMNSLPLLPASWDSASRREWSDGVMSSWGTSVGTIKELKWLVERGLRNDEDDVTHEDAPEAPQADRKGREPFGLWDCVHPCAIIVRAIQAGLLPCEIEDDTLHFRPPDEFMELLNRLAETPEVR